MAEHKKRGFPSAYKPEMCERLIEHMSKGYSFASFGAEVKCSRQNLYLWCDEYPEFKQAKESGTAAALKFFEQRLIAKISGQDVRGFDYKKCDVTALIFALKTRFHREYGEQQEVEEIDLEIDEN